MISTNSILLSPFSPLQIPTLSLWLDAKDPAGNGTQPGNGSSLATWVDKSKTKLNFSQATGANQPIFNTNILNGLPALAFNGSTTVMSVASFINTIQYTTFIVGKTLSTITTQSFYSNGNNGANGQGFSAVTQPSKKRGFLYGGAAWCEDGNPDTSNHIFSGLWNGTTSLFYVDNVSELVTNNTTPPTTPATQSLIGPSLNGNIYEILFFNSALNSATINRVYFYLKSKWGL